MHLKHQSGPFLFPNYAISENNNFWITVRHLLNLPGRKYT